MSFLGTIGHVMGGSGLNDLLETVYSPNAVVHMLTGKAVARAVRGQFLVDTALQTILLEKTIEVDIVSKLVTENALEISSENEGIIEDNDILQNLQSMYNSLKDGILNKDDDFLSSMTQILIYSLTIFQK
jgi:hypothetical protein